MDIALYKWLRQSADATVTIGRSVDCSLQISWDVMNDVAPIHASIVKKNDTPCLIPFDGVVLLNNREMKKNKSVRLYHGDVFKVGSINSHR